MRFGRVQISITTHVPSFQGPLSLHRVICTPSSRLIAVFPLLLNITELTLHLLYGFLVSRVFADVVTVVQGQLPRLRIGTAG